MSRRKRITKKNILKAAKPLFEMYGYQNVSVRDIAGVVGCSHSVIYDHFISKNQIFNNCQRITL